MSGSGSRITAPHVLDGAVVDGMRMWMPARRSFGQDDLERLLHFLGLTDRVVSVREAAATPPTPGEIVIALRHDVDHDLENAVRFAELEAERGFHASYYLLHTDWYFRRPGESGLSTYLVEHARRLAELGHEVALHNNAIAAALSFDHPLSPRKVVEREVSLLRDQGLDVTGTVAHGDRLCHQVGFVNYEIFTECPYPRLGPVNRTLKYQPEQGEERSLALDPFPMGELDLDYEANFVPRGGPFSDSGGVWHEPLVQSRDGLPLSQVTQVLVHPVWWDLRGEGHIARTTEDLVLKGSRLRGVDLEPLTAEHELPEPAAAPSPAEPAQAEVRPPEAAVPGSRVGRPATADTPRPAVSGYDSHYQQGGFGYAAKRATWVTWVKQHYVEAFDLQSGTRLVDVGCGDGFWTSVFDELGFVALGADLSTGGIEVARNTYPRCTFEVSNIESAPPFAGEQFDIVFCRAISHLCNADLHRPETLEAMRNMVGALADDGVLLLSFWSDRSGGQTRTCKDHTVSDLMSLVEVVADPTRYVLAGNYVQIAAKHRA